MNADPNILQVIGNTSLVELCKVVPPGCGQVFAKLEWENPTGSVKDRAALLSPQYYQAGRQILIKLKG
ncbi:MAG: hypothetical protein P4L35_18580 [Ignavibacteriaceae bacterium]|nr:hypothetical protein [Ignavibacteriaceae bacterium]